MGPSNEAETIELFKLNRDQLGWRIVHLQTAFPDAIIENARGQRLVIEFEYLAKNFKAHGHDPDGCDLFVCWYNNWPASPLPVWEICRAMGLSLENVVAELSVPVIVNTSLNDKTDRDILDWLDEQSNRSEAVRRAIRFYIARTEGPSLADILAEVRALPSRLSVVAVEPEAQEQGGDEPAAAAANLAGLLGRLGNDWE